MEIKDMDETGFMRLVGRYPEDDDLERVNCKRAGEPGHESCGLNIHGMPRFMGSQYKGPEEEGEGQ